MTHAHSPLHFEQFKRRVCRRISNQTIIVVARSYQYQLMTSVDDHMFVILTKAQQHVERYTKIKVFFLCVRSSVPSSVQRNQRFVICRYVVLDGNSDVFVAIKLHNVEFVSNFIKHERDAIICQYRGSTLDLSVPRQFTLNI